MSILWLVVLCLIQAEVQVFKMVSKAPYLHLLFLISVSTSHNFSLWSLNSSPTTLNPLTVWITTVEDSSRYGNTRSPDPPFRNLYTGQEATVRTGHGTTNWFQIKKAVHQGCILWLCLFNLYAEHIMWNPRLDEAQAGNKIARRNINNLRCADDTTLMAESKELESLLMKVREWKSWLKAQHSEN